MQAAIIAAGLGERLVAAGISRPKPLVEVAGQALIDYVLAGVSAAGIAEVACIVNEMSTGIEDHCRRRWPGLRFAFVRRTTPSSMESLFTLAPLLGPSRFLLLTVDGVCSSITIRDFAVGATDRTEADAVLALSTFVDDEKPLWARLDPDGRLSALGPEASGSGLVTAGFYVFDPVIFREIDTARQRGFTALRQFLGHLLTSGYRLYGTRVGKTVDVDRPEDLAVAEVFVRGGYRA
ncbi:NDP-sugar synthase [Candidatus Binatia bacterium]|nr:NDP-sugar synthase [Candidatus Binatia bacterium]